MALALRSYGPDSCFKNFVKYHCSVFVNVCVLRALFFQPVFSIFELYASNYAFVFAFEYQSNLEKKANQFESYGRKR